MTIREARKIMADVYRDKIAWIEHEKRRLDCESKRCEEMIAVIMATKPLPKKKK